MTCRRCLQTPVDPSFISPRQCAFTTGVFDTANWQCESMNRLRALAEPFRQYGYDESVAAWWQGDEDTGTFVLLHWYKNRGRTESCLIHQGVWRPPTTDEIDRIVQ